MIATSTLSNRRHELETRVESCFVTKDSLNNLITDGEETSGEYLDCSNYKSKLQKKIRALQVCLVSIGPIALTG